MLQVYDPSTDEMREVTQADIDHMVTIIQKVMRLPEYEVPSGIDPTFKFKLAVYPNRMRDGYAFIAEPKEIKPYPGVKTAEGNPVYPRMPDGPNCLPMNIPRNFAEEIVRRWNHLIEDTP